MRPLRSGYDILGRVPDGRDEGMLPRDVLAWVWRESQRVFTTESGADRHCQLGNLPLSCAVVYDWFDEAFAG